MEKSGARVAIGITVQGGGGAVTTLRPENPSEKRKGVRRPAGGNPADGNHILIAGKTGIADVDIIAPDAWVGTGVTAYRGDGIPSAAVRSRARAARRVVGAGAAIHQPAPSTAARFSAPRSAHD